MIFHSENTESSDPTSDSAVHRNRMIAAGWVNRYGFVRSAGSSVDISSASATGRSIVGSADVDSSPNDGAGDGAEAANEPRIDPSADFVRIRWLATCRSSDADPSVTYQSGVPLRRRPVNPREYTRPVSTAPDRP